jgi:hypothetical protein
MDLKIKLVRFYLYVYLDTNRPGFYNIDTSIGEFKFEYTPIYIGKGADNRMEYHQGKSCRNKRLKEKIDEGNFKCYVIKKDLPSHLAYKLESELIFKIGRIDTNTGPLFNETGGVILIEANKYSEIGPLHLEFNKLILILEYLNTSKTLKAASKKLGVSERSLYRYIKGYNLEKSGYGWYQIEKE